MGSKQLPCNWLLDLIPRPCDHGSHVIAKKVTQLKFFLEEQTNFETLNHNTHLCRLLTAMNFEVLSMEYGIHNWILFIHGFGVIFNQNCDDETWVCWCWVFGWLVWPSYDFVMADGLAFLVWYGATMKSWFGVGFGQSLKTAMVRLGFVVIGFWGYWCGGNVNIRSSTSNTYRVMLGIQPIL